MKFHLVTCSNLASFSSDGSGITGSAISATDSWLSSSFFLLRMTTKATAPAPAAHKGRPTPSPTARPIVDFSPSDLEKTMGVGVIEGVTEGEGDPEGVVEGVMETEGVTDAVADGVTELVGLVDGVEEEEGEQEGVTLREGV